MSESKEFTKLRDKETRQLHIRLPVADHDFVKRMADVENKSINNTLVTIIRTVKENT